MDVRVYDDLSHTGEYWLIRYRWYMFYMLGLRYIDDFEDLSWLYIFVWIVLFMPACYYSSWISWFTWRIWLIIHDIYLITILSMLPKLLKKYWYGNNTIMLYLLHVLLYRYHVHWYYISYYTGILITHVDVVTVAITVLS